MLRDLDSGVIPDGPDLESWTVVDCGANVGLFSLFLRRAKLIVAIEPNPGTNRRLKWNFERNDLSGAVLRAAISDRDGTVKMDFEGPSVLGAIGAGDSEVACLSLETICSEQGIESVDLLKLDVEGHEIEALEGCSALLQQGAVKRIVAEYNDEEALRQLDNYLRERGLQRVATGPFNARYDLA
jgi:FkbM family methyltransferase